MLDVGMEIKLGSGVATAPTVLDAPLSAHYDLSNRPIKFAEVRLCSRSQPACRRNLMTGIWPYDLDKDQEQPHPAQPLPQAGTKHRCDGHARQPNTAVTETSISFSAKRSAYCPRPSL
jgi:hypothetical protein